MRRSKWVPGRQEGILYFKLRLYQFRLGRWGFDAYILRYPAGTQLPAHKDPIKRAKHYRLNIRLKGKCIFFTIEDDTILRTGETLILFRPDLTRHGLTAITKTYKLSLGFAKFDKHEVDNV